MDKDEKIIVYAVMAGVLSIYFYQSFQHFSFPKKKLYVKIIEYASHASLLKWIVFFFWIHSMVLLFGYATLTVFCSALYLLQRGDEFWKMQQEKALSVTYSLEDRKK